MRKIIILILLVISTAAFSKSYKGAEVFSKEAVKYGKFEVRMMMVSEKGIVSSFFLYDSKSWQGPHIH